MKPIVLKPYSKANPLTVTVRRKRWLRGEGADPSRLLRSTDLKQCCLGFAACAIGVPRRLLLDTQALHEDTITERCVVKGLARRKRELEIGSQRLLHTAVAGHLMTTNDDPLLTEVIREATIAKLGARIGLRFQFVG